MMIVRISFILIIAISLTNAVVNKDIKRREALLSSSYGPPPSGQNTGLPVPIYGAPSQGIKYPPPPPDYPPPPPVGTPHHHYGIPQQEYGVPQRQPHREYGIPVAKYGPPKLNLQYGLPSKHNTGFGKSSFHEQIKSHFGVPRPVYGPPNYQKPNSIFNGGFGRPFPNYGPPPQHPRQNYGPPGRPQPPFINKPLLTYGTATLAVPSKPSPSYGPPPPKHNPIYVPPSTSYGVPENSISIDAGSSISSAALTAALSEPQREIQIQVETPGIHGNGQIHGQRIGAGIGIGPTVSCDGWKPIPGPVGQQYQPNNFLHNQGQQINHNYIQNQGGFSTGYHGLTDDQLIAVALQSGFIDGSQQYLAAEATRNVGIEQTNSLQLQGVEDSYSAPPSDSFAPHSIHATKYNTLNGDIANSGLVPPTNIYGTPLNEHYQQDANEQTGLGIQYGSESGNLRPWLNSGSAPRIPVSFRPPVPEGLLESIGHSVKHLDQFGVRPDNSQRQYIPPPSAEVPQQYQQQQHFDNLNDQNLQSFASEHVIQQALPAVHEARFNQPQDCGHGPNLVGANIPNIQYDLGSNQLANFNSIGESAGHGYGHLDNTGYESKQSSVSVQQLASHPPETKVENLPGLESLNIVSAQKSQSLTIPIQGQLASYQLQFQNANSGTEGEANHDQILSQGLLQSILSAIEQPQESNNIQQLDTLQDRVDHKDVDDFLKSPEGKQTFVELPKKLSEK